MFDEAYLCEVNLYIAEQILDNSLMNFHEICGLLMIERHYQIVISCHGGY